MSDEEDAAAEVEVDPLSLDADEMLHQLTPREQQVAMRLAVGHTNRAIAKDLKIGIKTVDTHRGNILRKLEIANNVLLAHLAIARGWVALQAAVSPRGHDIFSSYVVFVEA